jgi:cysteine desulfurase
MEQLLRNQDRAVYRAGHPPRNQIRTHPNVIYLDYNATAPIWPQAREAMARAFEAVGNPSSVHGPGRAAKVALEAARATVAASVGAKPRTVVFTSGGTEANALAMKGIAAPAIITSAIEHDSLLAASPTAQRCPVTADGVIDVAALEAMAQANPGALISVMAVNNETGVIQPISVVVAIAQAQGCLVHVDASQALGKLPPERFARGADFVTLSAHKIGGPPGVGALVARSGKGVAAQQKGGGQEFSQRAGTENLPGILGFAAAVEAIGATTWPDDAAQLRDRLEARLVASGGIVYGAKADRVCNTLCVGMAGVAAETQVIALDLAGFAVSAGAACSSGKVRASHVLTAMSVAPQAAGEAIRISLGWLTQTADVDAFAEAWTYLAHRRRQAAE